jgi:hypothetical protein
MYSVLQSGLTLGKGAAKMGSGNARQKVIRLVVDNGPAHADTAEFKRVTERFTGSDRRVVVSVLEKVHIVDKAGGEAAVMAMLGRAFAAPGSLSEVRDRQSRFSRSKALRPI